MDKQRHGEVVLVYQGGGALGAYQGGVFQALDEAGIVPDWVIGTSIGAINAALIAGNDPADRLPRLTAFWGEVQARGVAGALAALPFGGDDAARAAITALGLPGFFEPNPAAWFGLQWPLGAERAGYYDVKPLLRTLEGLIDLSILNAPGGTRLTMGAADVGTGDMRYFDSRQGDLTLAHVLASGALPPSFPAVRIDGDLFWDGGVLSNTPLEAVFDDRPRRNALVFSVYVWNPQGEEPDTLWKVLGREKDLRYASRTKVLVKHQRKLDQLRRVIAQLGEHLPDDARDDPAVQQLLHHGAINRTHLVRLMAPTLTGEDPSKDLDFSASGIRRRWQAGYQDTAAVLRRAPWAGVDQPAGLVVHEAGSDTGPR